MQRAYLGISFYILCIMLTIIGCIAIYSASYVYAFEQGLSSSYYLNRQILGLSIAILAGICIANLPTKLVLQSAPYAFITTLGLTLATLIPKIGITIHGASRWLNTGVLTIQPSEMLKICTIWYLSYFLDKKTFVMHDFYHTFMPAITIILAAILTLLLQPDFGQAVTLGATCCSLLYIFETPHRYLIATGMCTMILLLFLIIHAPYRIHRIITFLYPWHDPYGSGFQIIQSLIAIGNGGMLGQGITCSQQKYFYLPMQHTDFIFSILAEESGFIGSMTIIILFTALLYVGFFFAMKTSSRIAKGFILGYTLLVIIQALANISITLGILPTKGLGLPFISYGSSALVAHGIACGIIKHCWKNTHYQELI